MNGGYRYKLTINMCVDPLCCSINLYDYQALAVESMLKAGGGILKSKAGSGKTQMALAIITKLRCRTLWLTHTVDLLKQSYDRAAQYIDRSRLGTITGGKVNIKDITFATVQTMSKLDLAQYKNTFGCIVVDECHRVAGSPTKTTQFYKVVNSLSAKYKYGLSATVHRSDGLVKAMFALLGDIAYEVPDNVVNVMPVSVRIMPLSTKQSLSYCDTDGTIIYAKLINYIANNDDRTMRIARDIDTSISSLVLSDRKAQLEVFKEIIPTAEILTGSTPKAERERIIEKAKQGAIKTILSTYSLAKEGLDIPILARLYMATPVKDYAVVVQSIGRIARYAENKPQPIVYDYADINIGITKKMLLERQKHYKKEGLRIVE